MHVAKNIIFIALVVLLLATVFSILSGQLAIMIPVIGIFLIVWGIDKILCWYSGDAIGLRAGLEIPKNAPESLRYLGLGFSIFIIVVGTLVIIQYVQT